jgi:hypothetical protein
MEEEDKQKAKWLEGRPFENKKSTWQGTAEELERKLQDILTQR